MTKKSNSTAVRPKPGTIPKGLDGIVLTARFQRSDVDFLGFAKAVKAATPLVQFRENDLIRTVAIGGSALRGSHVHLSLLRDKSGRKTSWELEYEVLGSKHGNLPDRRLTCNKLTELILRYIPAAENPQPMLLSVGFNLSLKEWKPTIRLPFSSAGIADGVAGLPQIAGIEFAFPDSPATDTSMRRCMISTYDGIERLLVRLLATHSASFKSVTPQSLVDVCVQLLASFAIERQQQAAT
ncbi:MAG TPA: hypothetical protein VGM20_11035 [Gemmatimonadales bacterium]